MKLTDIDLNNPAELRAAHALLAVIIDAAEDAEPSQGGTAPLDPAAAFGGTNALPTGDVEPPQTALGGGGSIGLPANLAPAALPGSVGLAIPGVAAPTTGAPGVDVDTDGLPWDERIHAGTKSKNADGRWKKKKGLNDAAKVSQIEAELKARMVGGAAAAAPMPLPGVVGGATATALPPPGVALPPADPVNFEQLMTRLSPASASGAVPVDALQRVLTHHNIGSIVALQQHPEWTPTVWATLKASFPGNW